MNQQSNVSYRAEKEYKGKGFHFLLREMISNAFHAVLIKQQKNKSFKPVIDLSINYIDDSYTIKIKDNGDGFNENNQSYFNELDKQNEEKIKCGFQSFGQGRLTLIHFTNSAIYTTAYKNKNGDLKKTSFEYPNNLSLFDFHTFEQDTYELPDTFTLLEMSIYQTEKLKRAKSFFSRINSATALKGWILETFFPFIISNPSLIINTQNLN